MSNFPVCQRRLFRSGAELPVLETTHFLNRGQISADDACVGGFTGETIEMPSISLTRFRG